MPMILPSCNPCRPLLLVLFATLIVTPGSYGSSSPDRSPARIISVDDGDSITILMNGKKYRARMVGIDAPEIGQEPWGKKARKHLRELSKELRRQVFVETDIDQYDKYNRLLVYVWSAGGRLINEQMLLDGYAVVFTIPPNSRYAELFIKAERKARGKRRGIWGADGLKEPPLAYKKKHPRDAVLTTD